MIWPGPSGILNLEGRIPPETHGVLEARGHVINVWEPWDELTGHAHGLMMMESGVRMGVADPRSDGAAAGH